MPSWNTLIDGCRPSIPDTRAYSSSPYELPSYPGSSSLLLLPSIYLQYGHSFIATHCPCSCLRVLASVIGSCSGNGCQQMSLAGGPTVEYIGVDGLQRRHLGDACGLPVIGLVLVGDGVRRLAAADENLATLDTGRTLVDMIHGIRLRGRERLLNRVPADGGTVEVGDYPAGGVLRGNGITGDCLRNLRLAHDPLGDAAVNGIGIPLAGVIKCLVGVVICSLDALLRRRVLGDAGLAAKVTGREAATRIGAGACRAVVGIVTIFVDELTDECVERTPRACPLVLVSEVGGTVPPIIL